MNLMGNYRDYQAEPSFNHPGCEKQIQIGKNPGNIMLSSPSVSRVQLCDPMDCRARHGLWAHGLRSLPGFSVHKDFPGKNTGVGCHFLLQGIFLTQGSNVGALHYRQILYRLSYQGSPA